MVSGSARTAFDTGSREGSSQSTNQAWAEVCSSMGDNDVALLLPCRITEDARFLKEDAPEPSTVCSK
jgi:hypothetical protein